MIVNVEKENQENKTNQLDEKISENMIHPTLNNQNNERNLQDSNLNVMSETQELN